MLSQGVVHNLCILKGVLIREKPSVIKQRLSKPLGRLIEFVIIDKDFSGQLRLRVKFSSLWGVLSVKCIYDEAFKHAAVVVSI